MILNAEKFSIGQI